MKKLILAFFTASIFMRATAICAHAETQSARDGLIPLGGKQYTKSERADASIEPAFSGFERGDIRAALKYRPYLMTPQVPI